MTDYGKIAYEAYGDFVEWKNYLGVPLPQWEALEEKTQEAWNAAIRAVAEQWQVEAKESQVSIDDSAVEFNK